jgi:hypothetical protein
LRNSAGLVSPAFLERRAVYETHPDGDGGGSDARTINGSDALASFDSTATATNDGQANANGNCTATAQNGENVSCP